MQEADTDFQSAQEIGKIYQSITDSKLLESFYLDSVAKFIQSDENYLYLSGKEDRLWLESHQGGEAEPDDRITQLSSEIFKTGKPSRQENLLACPLIVRSEALGVACFMRKDNSAAFSEKDLDLAFNLSCQVAGALKNILLFEENLRMARLAAIGQTVGMVIHEIKNIMQLATLSDEFIRIGVKQNNEKFLNRGMDKMAKALRDMDGFIWEMLSLSKDYKLEPQKVSIASILKELESDLSDKAKDKKVELVIKADDSVGFVDADGKSLYRALLNLVKNAMEAMHDSETKKVSVLAESLDENNYRISVSDTGHGMSDEVKARLFEAFFSTKGSKGTGLGLMIIDRTVKRHHGKIEVQSEVGKGTSFILTLPKVISA